MKRSTRTVPRLLSCELSPRAGLSEFTTVGHRLRPSGPDHVHKIGVGCRAAIYSTGLGSGSGQGMMHTTGTEASADLSCVAIRSTRFGCNRNSQARARAHTHKAERQATF